MKQLIKLLPVILPLLCFGQKQTATVNAYMKLSFTTSSFTVTDYYITLDNNVNNESSALFISKKPTSKEILQAALANISDSFIVTKNNTPVYCIIVGASPYEDIVVTDLQTTKKMVFKSNFKGAVTANRAIEIVGKGYDNEQGGMRDGKLYFDNRALPIVSNDDIKATITNVLNELPK